MKGKILYLMVLLMVVWAIGGCVTMGKYDLKEKEATDSAKNVLDLQQKNASLNKENARLKAEVERLTGNVGDLTKTNDNLEADNKKLGNVLKAKSDELSRSISELRQKTAELENDNLKLNEKIANLQKAKVDEVQKTSKTYEEMLEKMKTEISQGQVTISELKGRLTVNMVDAILFDSGKAEVKPQGLVVLQKVTDILKSIKDKMIRIEGHTDNAKITGALARRYSTNWELSAARALNVTRYFQQQGINPTLLSAVAYGEFHPVAGNDTEEGKAMNRRIEIVLVPRETL